MRRGVGRLGSGASFRSKNQYGRKAGLAAGSFAAGPGLSLFVSYIFENVVSLKILDVIASAAKQSRCVIPEALIGNPARVYANRLDSRLRGNDEFAVIASAAKQSRVWDCFVACALCLSSAPKALLAKTLLAKTKKSAVIASAAKQSHCVIPEALIGNPARVYANRLDSRPRGNDGTAVIASAAKQSRVRDCFVAKALLAMTLPAMTKPRAAVLARAALLLFATLAAVSLSTYASAATPTGTIINNTGQVAYTLNGKAVTVTSNTVTLTTSIHNTPAVIEFLKYAPTDTAAENISVYPTEYSSVLSPSNPDTVMPNPVQSGTLSPVDLTTPVPLVTAAFYHMTDPVFVRLTDPDPNADPLARDTVIVTLSVSSSGDLEVLRLEETGPDTGVFMGYFQLTPTAAYGYDGALSVDADTVIRASYVDALDGSDAVVDAALVDPYGIVFDTATGLPVNGATVALMDATTGLPAVVHGDDGVSTYPSTITSGGSATDSSGKVYTFPQGEYRFPFVSPGQYYLVITPPNGYKSPSQVSTTTIQTLSGAPYAIEVGSRGEVFIVNPGPALHIDIPIDPVVGLYLRKSASKTTVSPGDFIQYKLELEDTLIGPALTDVVVHDRLPLGFRYKAGSAKLDGIAMSDPIISDDGRGLDFQVGNLPKNIAVAITYVVEVGAVTTYGNATNTAQAVSYAHSSNISTWTVEVVEDLFMSMTTIVGRVSADSCGEKEGTSLEGVRIYLEDGSYVITDKNGMYHFEGITPGTHVVQLDLVTVPKGFVITSCEENTRFAGVAHSQYVDLQPGALWRADFTFASLPKEPEKESKVEPVIIAELAGEAAIELSGALRDEKTGAQGASLLDDNSKDGIADYVVSLQITKLPLKNLRLMVVLPNGVSYKSGTSRLGGVEIADPELSDNVMTYRLGDKGAEWADEVAFAADVSVNGAAEEFTTKAVLLFDTSDAKNVRTPLVDTTLIRFFRDMGGQRADVTLRPHFDVIKAEIKDEDKAVLDGLIAQMKGLKIERMEVTGHTDSTRIAPRSRHIFADNYALSMARAASIAKYLSDALKLDPSKVKIDGKGPDVPVATNKTDAGRALNRRVELVILAEKLSARPELKTGKDRSGRQQADVTVSAETQAAAAALKLKAAEAAARNEAYSVSKTMPDYDAAWLDAAQPGLEWLWPYEGYNPPIPVIKIAIKTDPSKKSVLYLNGAPVNLIALDKKIKRDDALAELQLWTGVSIIDGDNLFEVVESVDGVETTRVQRVVHYSGVPVDAVLVPALSRLTADGKNPSVIALRFTDKDGKPAREGVTGEYTVDAPYTAQKKIDEFQETPLADSTNSREHYNVSEDGVAFIELAPTTQTGEAVINVQLADREEKFRVWLAPELRDWILVGLAEGSAGYDTVSGNMESLGDSGVSEDLYKDGRTAFFAKGKVKGEWLVTAAYDTEKNGRAKEKKGLFQTIDPDTYYTVYGDGSGQRYDAPSARAIYIRVERENFYALFGDYETGLTVTELSQYSRSFNGLKSEYKSDFIDYNLFLTDTNQAFVKDELRGDGTSGPYTLSRKDIVSNSDVVILETRDRFHSETVLSSQTLSRFVDYDIDYDRGIIQFKSPVYNRDENLDPIYIVVNYESSDSASDLSFTYGGRGAVKFLGGKLETGVTQIHEGGVGRKADLTGGDVTIKLSDKTKLRTEYAETLVDEANETFEGNAYLAEVSHTTADADGKVYVRQQSAGFGLGQQMGSETGMFKYGFDGAYKLSPSSSVDGEVYKQENIVTGATSTVAQAESSYSIDPFDFHLGLRHAAETYTDGQATNSDQILAGAKYKVIENKLSLRLDREQSLGSNNESADYPTRTIAGVDYNLATATTLALEHEFAEGEAQTSQTTRVGLSSAPWTGSQFSSSAGREMTESGARIYSSSGLKQTWQVTEKLSVDGGLDRTMTHKHPGNADVNINDAEASGSSEDYTAVSLGSAYRELKWSVSGRIEGRDGDDSDKLGFYFGANAEVDSGLGLLAGVQVNMTDSVSSRQTDADIRLGAAWRPKKTRFIVLDRLDWVIADTKGGEFDYNNMKFVNNLNINYKLEARTQISVQYGAKYVAETIDAENYTGYIDLVGIEGRYDVTKKWDVGLRVSALHSWSAHQYNFGNGFSVGYNFAKNVWASVGYNITGFRDDDFSKADFTAEGPFVKFRMKFDQESVREAVKWLGRE